MKKRIIVSTVLIGSLMTGGIAMAKSYGQGYNSHNAKGQGMITEEQHQQRSENRLERMAIILDLNDNQQAQIETLQKKHWQDRKAVRDKLRKGREERRSAMGNGAIDETVLRANLAKRAEFKADRILERAQMKQEIFALLTPEQQAKAEKLWESHKGNHGNRQAKGFRL
ncbi:MAG: Spy/CpxP family protein refolding chaperone [Deltaproteobacteria bacterium]|jgi:Spy/CpxP family protein refolding chaperone|nr:Spy/CpxP family protein refolding chaperone [Deltaproteobacteria bacterium]MCW8892273.1 Spy/CpxP family protein refolding chaperone [Deltaproteobacteria bacterium]MCW9049432.1 Spy/CpxP family protein refolding chaperone [Deltaproteobacteria bacterium]